MSILYFKATFKKETVYGKFKTPAKNLNPLKKFFEDCTLDNDVMSNISAITLTQLREANPSHLYIIEDAFDLTFKYIEYN